MLNGMSCFADVVLLTVSLECVGGLFLLFV